MENHSLNVTAAVTALLHHCQFGVTFRGGGGGDMQMEPRGALLVQPAVPQPHSGPLSLQQPPPHPQHQHTSWNSAPLFQKSGARRTNTQPAGETRNRFRRPPAEDELGWMFKDEFGKELRFHQPVFVAG